MVAQPSSPWATVDTARTVLAVVHNVTAATRLLDVIDLAAGDPRVQATFTVPPYSAFVAGTEQFLTEHGIRPLPWHEAVAARFDIAFAASHGGDLRRLDSPLMIIPHGMGYNKYLGQTVFGMSAEWLLDDGQLIPSSLVLSHHEQLDRLARDCAEAREVAVVAGDPCLDRMLASRPLRAAYRRALGATDGRRLVLISSTWGAASLFGQDPDLPRRLAASLRLDDYRVVLAMHPNVWQWHTSWQVRAWAESARRAGVRLLPPAEGWRAALVAADLVVATTDRSPSTARHSTCRPRSPPRRWTPSPRTPRWAGSSGSRLGWTTTARTRTSSTT